jgi:hypothetical protein
MVGKITGNQLSSTIIISGSFSGSFVGDGSGLSGTGGSTPTLQQITDAGASTTTSITASIISASGDIIANNLIGTASFATFAVTASHALFAVSASHEIIKEVSSSHADTSSFAGNLFGTPSIVVNNITASSNISASGDVFGVTGSFSHITNINEIRKDADTFIRLEDSKITLNSFGTTANSILEIGSLGGEESFVVKADTIKFQSYGANPIINISHGTNSTRFYQDVTASSDVKISGDITAVTNITASGNISASGDIFAHSGSFSYITASIIDVDGDTIRFGGEPFTKANIQTLKLGESLKPPRAGRSKPDLVGDDGIFEGNITSSGNISASGDIVANGLTTINNISGKNIFFSQDISGSINSSYFGDEYNAHGGDANSGFTLLSLGAKPSIFASGASLEIGNATNSTQTGIHLVGEVTASGNISASGDIIANKVTADVVDTSFETFLNFEAATAFTFIAPFPLTINFTGSSTSSMDVAGFVTASANTSTFSVQQTPPINIKYF